MNLEKYLKPLVYLSQPLSYLSYIDPVQHAGALYRWYTHPESYKNIDSIFDKDYWNLVRNNAGVVTSNFEKEHPWLAMGVNILASPGTIKGLQKGLLTGAKALYKTDIANRAKSIGLIGASGGVPAESLGNFKRVFGKGLNIGADDPVHRLPLANYVLTGNRNKLYKSNYRGYSGHINVDAPRDFERGLSLRHVKEYTDDINLTDLTIGLRDSHINVPESIYKPLVEANLGLLPNPIKIRDGVVIGGKNAIHNESLLKELNGRSVQGGLDNWYVPVVGNVGPNTENAYKALLLLNSEKEVIKSGVRRHSIKAKGREKFDTAGINQYIYKSEDGSLLVVEVDIFDHAHTATKGKYATDLKGILKLKVATPLLKNAELTPAIILNYHKGLGSKEFCNFAMNNLTDKLFDAIKTGNIESLTKLVSFRAIDRKEMKRLIELMKDSKDGLSLKYSFKPELYKDIIRDELYKQCTSKGFILRKDDPTINAAAEKIFNEVQWYMSNAEKNSMEYVTKSRNTFTNAREKLITENTPEHFNNDEIDWIFRNPKGTKKMVADKKAYTGINLSPLQYILQEANVQTPKKLKTPNSQKTKYLNRQDLALNALYIIRNYSPNNREIFIKNYRNSSFKELLPDSISDLTSNPKNLDNYMEQLQSQLFLIDSSYAGIKSEYGTLPQIRISKQGTKLLPKAKSGIHIKKENRGKFTSYCGGKVTDACIKKAKASGNPTLVKRATFAENARKWKH